MASLAMAVLVAILVAIGGTGPARAQDVIGDDERDMFVGTGSLILPVSMPRPGREGAADCPGCSWKATLACDPVSPTACRGQARLCPNDHFWLRIWLRRPGGEWQTIGSDCFSPGGPATRVRVEIGIRERLEQAVPALRPTRWPARGVLVHLPVAFDSGQAPGPRGWTWDILGVPVTVTATPRWTWQFAQGAPLVTVAGSQTQAPSAGQVTHVYRSAGPRRVRVSTTWSATYSVPGLGNLAVEGDVRQVGELAMDVGQARAVLIR